jgi:hypothetical protein
MDVSAKLLGPMVDLCGCEGRGSLGQNNLRQRSPICLTQINFVDSQRFISAAMRSRPASPSVSLRRCTKASCALRQLLRIIAILPAQAEGHPRYRSNHYQINPAVLEALPRQTIPGHFFDPVPILAEITRCLLLGLKFRLQDTRLALISVCNLEKDRLPTLFHLGFAR